MTEWLPPCTKPQVRCPALQKPSVVAQLCKTPALEMRKENQFKTSFKEFSYIASSRPACLQETKNRLVKIVYCFLMSNVEFNLFQVFLWFFSHISYTVFGWLDVNFTFCVMAADLSAYGFHFPPEDGWAEFHSPSSLVNPSMQERPLSCAKPFAFYSQTLHTPSFTYSAYKIETCNRTLMPKCSSI